VPLRSLQSGVLCILLLSLRHQGAISVFVTSLLALNADHIRVARHCRQCHLWNLERGSARRLWLGMRLQHRACSHIESRRMAQNGGARRLLQDHCRTKMGSMEMALCDHRLRHSKRGRGGGCWNGVGSRMRNLNSLSLRNSVWRRDCRRCSYRGHYGCRGCCGRWSLIWATSHDLIHLQLQIGVFVQSIGCEQSLARWTLNLCRIRSDLLSDTLVAIRRFAAGSVLSIAVISITEITFPSRVLCSLARLQGGMGPARYLNIGFDFGMVAVERLVHIGGNLVAFTTHNHLLRRNVNSVGVTRHLLRCSRSGHWKIAPHVL